MRTENETRPSRKKGVVQHAKNPFWGSTEVKVGTKMIKVSGGTHISEDGQPVTHSGVHVVKKVDETEFVKIYTQNMKMIFDLKPSAQKILQYLLSELQSTVNADSIYLGWFSAERYFSEQDMDISRASFQRSLKDLLEKGFIAESHDPNMFWINPNLFFNGNRMSFIQEYRKESSKPQKGTTEEQGELPL